MLRVFQAFYYIFKSEIWHESFTVFYWLHQPEVNIIVFV